MGGVCRGAVRAVCRGPRRWWWRAGLVVLLLGVLVPAGVVLHYSRPAHLGPLLERLLSERLGGPVSIGQAKIDWRGLLVLEGLKLRVDPEAADAAGTDFSRLFEAERVEVQLGLAGLWRGELRVAALRLDRPQLHIVEDQDTGRINFQLLRRQAAGDGGLQLRLPPRIRIDAARVEFARIRDGRRETVETVRLAGELEELEPGSRRYAYELRQYDASARQDAKLTGTFDAARPALDLTIENFEVETVYRQLLPAGLRRWWDPMAPAGRLPRLTLSLRPDDAEQLRLEEVALELADLALTPPWAAMREAGGDEGGAEGGPLPRMTQVSGRIVARQDEVRIRDLTGIIAGVRFHAQGRWSLAERAAGSLRVSTDPFELGARPDYLPSLPAVAQELFDRLEPRGRFQAAATFQREAAGAPLAVRGTLKLLGAEARFYKFPFPLRDLRGRIHFDRDAVRLERLTATGPAGGVVTLDGEISPPSLDAAVRVAVSVRGVPFDEAVMEALEPQHRAAASLFFDTAMHALLVDEGVIRSAVRESPVEGLSSSTDVPLFDLGGQVNADILVDRPRGVDMKTDVTTRIDAAGVHAMFRHFPYPLVGRSGRIVIEPGRVGLEEVEVSGVTGGRAVVRGQLVPDPDDRMQMIPDLRIEEVQLPLDDVLLHAIRAEQRRVVADLHATGRLTGGATITQPPGSGRVRWEVEAQVHDATARPYGGALTLNQITGGFTLGNDGLTIHHLAGRRGDAAVQLAGEFDWASDPRRRMLEVTATDLPIEPTLLEVLAPDDPTREKVRGVFEQYRPAGLTDAQLVWEELTPLPEASESSPLPPPLVDAAESLPAGEPSRGSGVPVVTELEAAVAEAREELPQAAPRGRFSLALSPQRLAVSYRGQRLEFPQVEGRAVVHRGYAELEELDLRFATGHVTLNGIAGLDTMTPTALTFRGEADLTSPTARALLPPPVVAVLEQLEVKGTTRLRHARLYHRPSAPPLPAAGQSQPKPADGGVDDSTRPSLAAAATEFDAEVQLVEAQLTLGVPITQLHGLLQVRLRQEPGEARPRMGLELVADHLRAADRRVAPLQVVMDNAAQPDRLRLRDSMGGVYGGVLVLEGSVPLEPTQPYRVDVTLSDVEVEAFLRPAEADPTHGMMPVLESVDEADPQRVEQTPMLVMPFSNLQRDLRGGLMSASLSLEAPLDQPDRRLGRGALRIRDARLYDKPLSNALLRATSFALPSGAPLDSASARFLVDGPTVYFDELSMEGPGIRIEGGGTMSTPETALDLVMVPRATGGPQLGPISDLINFFKDELIAIHVTGTLAEPRADLASLTGLTRGWTDTFGAHRATLDSRDNPLED